MTARPARRPRRGRRPVVVWLSGLATLFGVVAASVFLNTPLDRLSPLVFDFYQRLQPRAEAGATVTVVDIDEASIAELGQWPWPRSVIAGMVDRLGEMGAATVAFDIVFPEPDRTSLSRAAAELELAGAAVSLPADTAALDNDAVLAAAFARNNVTAGIVLSGETEAAVPPAKAGFAFGGADPRGYLPQYSGGVVNLPGLTEAAAGAGFFSFPPSRDGIVRTIPLVAAVQGELYPALSLEALRIAQGAGSFVIRSTGASGEADTGRSAMVALQAGALEVPTGPAGDVWVYFSGLPSMATISAARLLDADAGEALARHVDGHIVLIGTSAVGLRDIVATPVSAAMPGVLVHAEIIDQIVGQTFLTRPDWAPGAEIAAALVLGVILVVAGRRASAPALAGTTILVVATALGISWSAFSAGGLLLDPILPAVATAAVFAVVMPLRLLLTDRERNFVRGAFGRYLAPALVERLADDPDALALGGETRELTILFSDIRGFTALSESLDPQELTGLLNALLTPTTDVLLRHEATIDKYMGDAIMAFWNAPVDIADHRRKACLAALEMTRAVERLNAERGSDLEIGIGVHTGPACVGNLGSSQRFSYSAIGDSVNLASRVEGLTRIYGVPIVVTTAARDGAPDMAFLEIDLVRVVGRHEPVAIHALLGDGPMADNEGFRKLADAHGRMIAAYRAGDADAAGLALAEGKEHGLPQLERLHEVYASRLEQMRRQPPPADWDGVFVAGEK